MVSVPEEEICGASYGTGQGIINGTVLCERRVGHPPVSEDRIGHWGAGDLRFSMNPDLLHHRGNEIDEMVKTAANTLSGAVERILYDPKVVPSPGMMRRLLAQTQALIELMDDGSAPSKQATETVRLLVLAVQDWAHTKND